MSKGILTQLREEHALIGRVLVSLRGFAADLDAGRPADREVLAQFVDFLQRFADDAHHVKEEEVLFPALRYAGADGSNGVLWELLDRHAQSRSAAYSMAVYAAEGGPWTDADLRAAAVATREACDRYEVHMRIEEEEVFPLAERVLSSHDMHLADRSAARVDATWTANGERARLTRLGEVLAGRVAGAAERDQAI